MAAALVIVVGTVIYMNSFKKNTPPDDGDISSTPPPAAATSTPPANPTSSIAPEATPSSADEAGVNDNTAEKVNTALLGKLDSSLDGMSEALVDASRKKYGDNRVTHGKNVSLFKRICIAFINPFTAILFGLAAVSAFTDIILAEPGETDPITVIIIITMVLISGLMRFVQETRSGNAADKLLKMIKTTTCVQRQDGGKTEIPLEEVVVGDIIHLAAGDMIPADMRII